MGANTVSNFQKNKQNTATNEQNSRKVQIKYGFCNFREATIESSVLFILCLNSFSDGAFKNVDASQ